ncbi:mor transcription activator [Desulfoluna spongiiphila]|nr:mor transcription activator [Desulfoluna spongiiphila]
MAQPYHNSFGYTNHETPADRPRRPKLFGDPHTAPIHHPNHWRHTLNKQPLAPATFSPDTMDTDHIMDAMDPVIRSAPRVWPALLTELVDVLTDHLETREKMAPDLAMTHAQDIVVVLSHHLGGRSVYLPRDDRLKRAIRDAAIYHAFTGDNHRELAMKSKLTTAQIYNIIKKQRALRQARTRDALTWS